MQNLITEFISLAKKGTLQIGTRKLHFQLHFTFIRILCLRNRIDKILAKHETY